VRVIVTGGAGFIGAHVCRALTSTPAVDRVVALDNLSTGAQTNISDGVDLVVGDIRNRRIVDKVFRGADTIIHLAARPSVARSIDDPVASHLDNTWGTLQVLEAARRVGIGHVIVSSSSSVYGASVVLPKSEDVKPSPLSPYAAQKLAAETYTLAHAHTYGFKALVFRFFNVFGPLQPAGHSYAAAVPAFIQAARTGRPLPIHGSGLQTRDFTYVESVAEVVTRAVTTRLASPEPVNLAFGGRSSLLQVAAELEQILGRSLPREHLPSRPGDVTDSQADSRRLRSLIPDVEPISMTEGLRRTVEWFETDVWPRAT
jgi:UDP-glucose 4-epimerase